MKFIALLGPLPDQVKANARLQVGLGVTAGIMILWIVLVLADWREARISVLKDSIVHLEQTRSLARQTDWPERAAQAQEIVETLKAEIPQASSPGMAQAEFQGWLRELAEKQSLPVRMEVQAPVHLAQPENIVRVSATLNGSLPPGQVLALVERIESRQSLATVPVMTLRSDTSTRSFSMTVNGYYSLEQGTSGQ